MRSALVFAIVFGAGCAPSAPPQAPMEPLTIPPLPAGAAPPEPEVEAPPAAETPTSEDDPTAEPARPPSPPGAGGASLTAPWARRPPTAPLPRPGTPLRPPGIGTGVFNRAAAAASLAAIDLQSCKVAGGLTGAGHAALTFDPNGHVSTVTIDGGPYPGTPEATCIATKLRAASVPPFRGVPELVGKSFVLQ